MDLDMLLDEARETEPLDDGFTDRVMFAVRADASTAWRHKRFFTRPMALAAAALLVTGGALAARTISMPEPTDLAEPPAREEAELVTGPSVEGAIAPAPEASAEVAADEVAEEPEPTVARRHGGFEWGYAGPHTAYALHLDSGLRLETETYTNSFALGRPHEVTLTLANTGQEAVAVEARYRCALLVSASRSGGRDEGSSMLEPSRERRGSQAQCAAGEAPGREEAPERFVLAPGEQRVFDTVLVFDQEGDWAVAGMCRCTFGEVSDEPEETEQPDGTLRLPDLNLTSPLNEVPEIPSRLSDPRRGGAGLVTPPIHVQVTR